MNQLRTSMLTADDRKTDVVNGNLEWHPALRDSPGLICFAGLVFVDSN